MASRIDEENNKPKMSQEERDILMQEFLSKGVASCHFCHCVSMSSLESNEYVII